MTRKGKVTSWYVILAVLVVATMYHTNTSSFVVLIQSVANEMLIPFGGDMAPDQVGWLISIPSLFMIPGVLLSGVLLQKIRMRTLMISAWVLFGISGAAIYFCTTTVAILSMRAVMGFAIGLCVPSSRALPSRIYDDNWRARVIGWIEFVGGAMSIFCSVVFGQIAMANWRLSMFVYPIIALVFIILAIAFIPNLPVEKQERVEKQSGLKRPLGQTTWALTLAALVIFVVGAVIQIKTSTLVEELRLGGPDVAAIVSMANTFGIVIGGLIFGFLYKKLQRWLFPVALLGAAACYFWFALSQDLVSLCISGGIANLFTIGTVIVYTVARVTYTTPPERITFAVSLVTFAMYIGQVFTTPFINLVEAQFGGLMPMASVFSAQAGMEIEQVSASVSLIAVGVVFAALFVIATIYIIATRSQDAKVTASLSTE
jgi:predicted MFS family arabinose efflux permease